MSRLKETIDRLGIRVPQVAKVLGLRRGSVYQKLTGDRSWKTSESIAVVDYLRQWDPSLTVEDLFGSDAPSEAPCDSTDRADRAA